ncbi:MAG: hypothetical protein PHX09_01605 [Clostridia bacterium]|nr:hypothetical protein [Clostridia bacterium]MDD4686208.1 hypothetical protein [Clostridia bacterium]
MLLVFNFALIVLVFFSAFVFKPYLSAIMSNPVLAQSMFSVSEKSTGDTEMTYGYNDYADNPSGFSVTLTVNYNFEIGDSITYYYLKTDSISVKYQTVKSLNPTLIVDNTNIGTAGDITFNPYLLDKSGSYNIFALIQVGLTGEKIRANSVNITLNAPSLSQLELKIYCTELQGASGELKTYFFSADILLDGKKVNSEDYVIYWYFGYPETYPYSNKSSFEWKPNDTGNYLVFAKISDSNVKSKILSIVIDYDRTKEIILIIVGAVALMTLFVIITTYIKVKNERVW